MKEPEVVTVVTRNDKAHKLKLIVDVATTLAVLYYLQHPDVTDTIEAATRKFIAKCLHRVSVWNTVQEIRSLPEKES